MTTYQKISEQIRTIYYKGKASDDADFSLRDVANLVANEVADQATRSAYNNSNQGETTYANDIFTSTFTNLSVLFDSTLKVYYTTFPQVPAALPNNQEIVRVWPVGSIHEIIPMKNKNVFIQRLLPSAQNMILYYIENNRIVYDNISQYMPDAVNMDMVGAISTTGSILDGMLNVPQSAEKGIIMAVLGLLMPTKGIQQDVLNDAVSQ